MFLIDIANISTRSHRSEFKCFGFIQKNRFPFCFRSHNVRYRSYRYKSTVSESVFNDLITFQTLLKSPFLRDIVQVQYPANFWEQFHPTLGFTEFDII